MQALARIGFWVSVALSFIMAAHPHPPRVPGDPSDKVLHVLAFSVLGVLAGFGFPRIRAMQLVSALVVYGSVIELVQAIPALHRDSSLLDLFFDAVAAVTSVAVVRFIMVQSGSREKK